ncbi:MAG: hypothetical protein KF875_14925 [Trueperaceae bacterium]|nr:hypothetical protein [Trueperaceae bacterium]
MHEPEAATPSFAARAPRVAARLRHADRGALLPKLAAGAAVLTLCASLGLAWAQGATGVKGYLLGQLATLQAGADDLAAAAQTYYDLAAASGFDYQALAAAQGAAVGAAVGASLDAARAGWLTASPAYESVEGIVAGVELMAQFDVDLDAGLSAAEGDEDLVSFDLTLPDGQVLAKPGNLFGVTESTLWATFDDFTTGVAFDVDGDGAIGFGDSLPEAGVLLAAGQALAAMAADLTATAETWEPTPADVFGALVGNVPTVAEVFVARWRESRFVLGSATTMRDFGVISSLQDLNQNIASWRELYREVSPLVAAADASADADILASLADLGAWADEIAAAEANHTYTPEEADLIYDEGDRRATAITGAIAQAAALVGVEVE